MAQIFDYAYNHFIFTYRTFFCYTVVEFRFVGFLHEVSCHVFETSLLQTIIGVFFGQAESLGTSNVLYHAIFIPCNLCFQKSALQDSFQVE